MENQKDLNYDARELQLINVDRVALFDTIIPMKAQKGLLGIDLEFTRLQATGKFIAIGSNVGTVFLYERKCSSIHRLKYKGTVLPVTCITAMEMAHYLLLAVGYSNGSIISYKVEIKNDEDDIDNEQNGSIENVLVLGFHRHEISSLEWSSCGYKLYSGDKIGNVAVTEVDFKQSISKPSILVVESHSIVQLNFLEDKLLVSTTKRSAIVAVGSKEANLTQVGQQQRKILGNFGAHFYVDKEAEETFIFASRPSLRIWKTSADGGVKETFIFRNDPDTDCQEIPLMWRKHMELQSRVIQSQFGMVRLFSKFLVTSSQHSLYIIDPRVAKMLARCEHFDDIRDLSVTSDEIFILDQKRSITRISSRPDNGLTVSVKYDEKRAFSFNTALKELEFKIKDASLTHLLDRLMPKSKDAKQGSSRYEESFGIDLDSHYVECVNIADNSKNTGHDTEGDIVYKPQKRNKVYENEQIERGPSADARISENSMDISCRLNELFEKSEKLQECEELQHSTDSIQSSKVSDMESKEKLLVEMLGLKDLSPRQTKSVLEVASKDSNAIPHINPEKDNSNEINAQNMSLVDDNVDSNLNDEFSNETDESPDKSSNSSGSMEEKDPYHIPSVNDRIAISLDSYLSYGPPSGSSLALDNCSSAAHAKDTYDTDNAEIGMEERSGETADVRIEEMGEPKATLVGTPRKSSKRLFSYENEWVQFNTPGQIKGLSVCQNYVCCIDSTDRVYFSQFGNLGLQWRRTDVQAQQIAVSPNGVLVWRVHDNSAYALMKQSNIGPYGSNWIEVMLGVNYVAVDDTCAWILKQNGEVCTQQNLGREKVCGRSIHVPYKKKLCQISCLNGTVWALCWDGSVIGRTGVTRFKPEGLSWEDVGFDRGSALCVAVGRGEIGWVFDGSCYLWFKTGVSSASPGAITYNKRWWQATISECLYNNEEPGGSIFTPLKSFVDSLPTEQLMALITGAQTPSLSANSDQGLWLHQPYMSHVWTCRAKINGHHWRHLRSKNTLVQAWKLVSASGVYNKQGAIWLLEESGDIVALMPNSGKLHKLDLPSSLKTDGAKVTCVAAAPETLWLLMSSGKIIIRSGIIIDSPLGVSWEQLEMSQIAERQLVHISCGSNSVWACDTKGNVLIRFGSLKAPSHTLPPAWIVVDESTESPQSFVKVFVGSSDLMVWAIDSRQNVYAREAVFSDLPVGISWVLVPGIKAVTLSVSETAVWVLTSHGDVYCRYGITPNCYIGDFWKQIPATQFADISVTVDDNTWAIGKDSELFHHSILSLEVMGKPQSTNEEEEWTECEHQATLNSLGDDWEWL